PLIHKRVLVVLKARGFLSVQDQDDVFQEVMQKLLTSLHSYDPSRGPFFPWLDTMTRHRDIDHHHLEKRCGIVLVDSPGVGSSIRVEGPRSMEDFDSPVDHAQAIFQSIDVNDLLLKLPLKERMLLFNRYFDGYSIAQLANLHGETERNIKYWIDKA